MNVLNVEFKAVTLLRCASTQIHVTNVKSEKVSKMKHYTFVSSKCFVSDTIRLDTVSGNLLIIITTQSDECIRTRSKQIQ